MGNENFTAAPSATFRTKDGLLNIAANETYQYENLCDLLGRPDLKADHRFSDRHIRKKNRVLINKEIESALLTRTAAEWEVLLSEAGVPAGRVMSVPEILSHPHIQQSGFVATLEGEGGAQHITQTGFRLSDQEIAPAGPAPLLSAHTDEWLRKLGYDSQQIEQMRSDGVI